MHLVVLYTIHRELAKALHGDDCSIHSHLCLLALPLLTLKSQIWCWGQEGSPEVIIHQKIPPAMYRPEKQQFGYLAMTLTMMMLCHKYTFDFAFSSQRTWVDMLHNTFWHLPFVFTFYTPHKVAFAIAKCIFAFAIAKAYLHLQSPNANLHLHFPPTHRIDSACPSV